VDHPASALPPLRLASSVGRRRPLISLTPLIDVVFILLVFFMLASSFLDWRSIVLSAPGQAVAGGGMEGALLIEVRTDGLRLSGERVTPEALEARIGERLAEHPDRRCLIKPAPGVSLQEVIDILDRVSGAGAVDVSFIRDPGR